MNEKESDNWHGLGGQRPELTKDYIESIDDNVLPIIAPEVADRRARQRANQEDHHLVDHSELPASQKRTNELGIKACRQALKDAKLKNNPAEESAEDREKRWAEQAAAQSQEVNDYWDRFEAEAEADRAKAKKAEEEGRLF